MNLYDSDKEKKQHADAITAISTQYGLDAKMVGQIYESRLASLKDTAKIKTYLSVLTIRAVKDYLHETAVIDATPDKSDLIFQ